MGEKLCGRHDVPASVLERLIPKSSIPIRLHSHRVSHQDKHRSKPSTTLRVRSSASRRDDDTPRLASRKGTSVKLGGFRGVISQDGERDVGRAKAAVVRGATVQGQVQGLLPVVAEIRMAGAASLRQIAEALNARAATMRPGGLATLVHGVVIWRSRRISEARGYD